MLADDGRDLAAAIQTIIEAGFDELQRAVAEAFDGATVSVAVHDGLFDLQLHQRGMCAPARRRTIRRHTAIPAVGRRPAQSAAAFADGAQRAGDLAAPRPGAAVGVTDPGRREVGRRSSSSPTRSDAGNPRHGARHRRRGDSDAVEIALYKELGETRVQGLGLPTTPPLDLGKR